MADANLVVRVRATGERNLDQIRRKLDRITVSATAAGTALKAFSKSYGNEWNRKLDDIAKKWTRHFDELDKAVRMTGQLLTKGLSLAIKAVGAEFVLMGAAMIGVHGLFGAGNMIMKAYTGTLNVLAGAAAAAAVALASVAAAMREQNAAMFAYKGTGYREFGNGLNQVRVVMRGLENDTRLAVVGVENLNAAYAAVSKRSTFNRGSQSLLRGLMDFASAGQPLDQGVKAAGELIGVLQDPKASFSEISKAAEALGPSMKKAMEQAKKEGIDTAEELRKAINDGTLAAMGGVEGQFDAVNSTLMSVLKSGFNQIRAMFADLGQPFLKPLKEASEEILTIFRRTFIETFGALQKFGTTSFIDGLVGAVEKMMNLFRVLVVDYLPATEGMMKRISDRWDSFTDGWNRILDALRPLIKGAEVLEDVLGAIFGPVWDRIKEKFGDFNQQLQDNRGSLMEFGDALGEMLVSFSRITDTVRDLFFQALPFITKIVNGITQVANLLNGVLSTMGKMFGGSGGGFGAFGLLMGLGIVGRQMRATQGGFVPKSVGNMTVNAGNVVVTGATAGGQMYPGAAGRQGLTGAPMPGYTSYNGGGTLGGMSSQRQVVNAANIAANQGYPLTPAQGRQMGLTPAQINQANARGARKSGGTFKNGAGGPGFLQRFSGGSRFGPRNLRNNNAYRRVMRANQTGSARMGAMAGLGIASQFMPEETQGAMALGSAIGAYNPLLGLGVAGIGTALTSQNAVVGALGGAAGGAAIGFQVAGPAGAAAGALIGLAIGGIKAGFNKGAAKRKAAKEAAQGAAEDIYSSMIEGISAATADAGFGALTTGSIRGTLRMGQMRDLLRDTSTYQKTASTDPGHEARQDLVRRLYRDREALGFEMSREEYENALEKPHEFIKTLNEELTPTFEAQIATVDKFEDRMWLMQRAFSMTEEEVLQLAQTTGTNLFAASRDTNEMLKQMAEGLITTQAQLQNSLNSVAAEGLTGLRVIQEQEKAPEMINEAARNLLDLSQSDGVTRLDAAKFAEDYFMGLQALYGGDAEMAALQFNRRLAEGEAFGQGQLLAGLGADEKAMIMEMASQVATPMIDTLGTGVSESLLAAFAQAGFTLSGATGQEFGRLATADPARFKNFTDAFYALGDDATAAQIDELLSSTFPELDYGLDLLDASARGAAINLENASAGFVAELEKLEKALGDAVLAITGEGDTSTPRGAKFGDTLSSRYSRTMSAHSQLDQMTSGKRTMTSGWRSWGLGSPSSDHVMGRAYDLVGQNLGAYKSLVDASGGFAEFHGSAGNRHLHVVPNTSGGPVGDTTSVMGGAVGGGSYGNTTNNSYTINVNGANSSPQEIAEEVMSRIKQQEISMRERR